MLLPIAQPVLERLLTRAYASSADAASDVCKALCEVLNVDLAFVTAVDAEGLTVVAAEDRPGLGLTAGTRVDASDAFCTRALAGTAPTWTSDLASSAHADVTARSALGVTTYAMVPLRDPAGQASGTLCFVDRAPVERDVAKERFLHLLGGLLVREQELERVRQLEATSRQALADRAADLARSENRYRALVDDIRDIVVRVGPDGCITFVNQAWTELTGVPVADVVGRSCFDRVHPDDQLVAAEHLQAAAAGLDTGAREVRFLSADGTYRWMAVKGQALLGEDRELAGFAGMLEDVTERRQAQEQVRAALAQAESARDEAHHSLAEAQRASRAKSEFLSRMSHELRTPLNAILGFAQLLELGDLDGEDADNVQQISGAGRHLLDLINEVLDVVRVESGKLSLSLEPVDVGEVVAESLDLVRPAAGARSVGLQARQTGAVVLADRQRLKQVLVNLLSNAVKYNVEHGSVVLDCVALAPEDAPAGDSPHGWLRLTVHDTGVGIAAEHLEDAFTPFERLGAEGSGIEGTGIGLSLTKTLVEALGGRIGLTSRLGRGTTFWVDLPAAAPAPPAGALPAPEPESTCTVLYVEDNPSNITLVRRVLARRPHVRLLVERDGTAGVEAARRVQPDLVLLDLHLPGLDGEQVLAALRGSDDAALRDVPVVVVTADLTPGVEQRLLQAGADLLMPKPIDVPGLLELLDQHVAAA